MTTITAKLCLVCFAVGTMVTAAGAASLNALELCQQAEFAAPDAAAGILDSGVRAAEAAVASSPEDPVAHFALFCNLAKRMAMRGFGLSMILDLPRLYQALDRSLALAPGYADAIAAKGALLYYTPRIAGGDAAEGERLIRIALSIDPGNPVRLVLVGILTDEGAVEDAREEAQAALAVIGSSPEPRIRAGARAILRQLCTQSSEPHQERGVLQQVCRSDLSSRRLPQVPQGREFEIHAMGRAPGAGDALP